MQPPKKKSSLLLESTIQASVIRKYEREGWLVNKVIQCTNNGWPDLECYKDGQCEFVECKRPGEKPDPLQLYRHEQLRKQGFTVKVIDYLC